MINTKFEQVRADVWFLKQLLHSGGSGGNKIMTLLHLPACPLPGMLLSRGNISEHFSRSTCPVRQSSVMIWRALWHKVMLSSVRTLMSLLLSHCTPEGPGGRWFIWAPLVFFLRTAECSLSAGDSSSSSSGEARCVLIHIQCATRSDWTHTRPAFE